MPMRGLAKAHRLFQYRVEHRGEVAGRRVDDLQDLGGRRLSLQRLLTLSFALVTLGCTLGKLTFEIGYTLLGIG
jgi:hypothetical protein